MQFSLAAGSDSTVGGREIMDYWPPRLAKGGYPPPASLQLTNALHEGWVQAVCEQWLWKLPEVQLQCPRDGVDVHVTEHH